PHIARAFAALGGHDLVLGPATDGGFWLVGGHPQRLPRGLFTHVRWSTRHALDDTIASAPEARVALTDRLSDIDTAADLLAHRAAHRASRRSSRFPG
ncbi:DUF2064 domain-containing protein, partial [Cribrihabitans sp. XS_ASV171]